MWRRVTEKDAKLYLKILVTNQDQYPNATVYWITRQLDHLEAGYIFWIYEDDDGYICIAIREIGDMLRIQQIGTMAKIPETLVAWGKRFLRATEAIEAFMWSTYMVGKKNDFDLAAIDKTTGALLANKLNKLDTSVLEPDIGASYHKYKFVRME